MVLHSMASRLSFWLLLTVLISAPSTNDGAVAYVKPSNNVTCPDQPCRMLNDYAREQDQYFLDGTTFMFLPGIHQLDLQLRLENISNVSLGVLEEDGSAQILFSPMVNITWLDSNNITITGLEVFLSGQSSFFSALVFNNTSSFLSKLSLFGNESFQSTAINADTSVVELSDVMFSGARSIYGAALVAFNSTINFIGQNYFVNNTASQGGAMYIIGQSVANFQGNVTFVDNTATQGGAITISQSVANFQGNILFMNNIAYTSNFFPSALGGAIYCEGSALSFSGSVLLQRNQAIAKFGAKGGGISAQLNSVLTFETSSHIAFTENSAMSWGGAISVNSGSELTMLGNTLFEANFAPSGGGALRGEANSIISCHSNSSGERIIFRKNYGGSGVLNQGGAIYTTQLSDLELEGVLFDGNEAGSGGAISSQDLFLHVSTCNFYNNTALSSGAVSFTGTNAIFDGTNNFQRNQAGSTGIVSVSFANVNFSGENNFLNNIVTGGSGGLTLSSSSAHIGGNLTFSRNNAFLGGGLYGIQSNLMIDGNSLFIGNTATRGGGMMFIMCTLNITGRASFIQNAADVTGSAVLIRDSNASIGGNMNISDSLSTDSPSSLKGSLSFLNCTIYLTGVLILENNRGDEGGAINARDSEVTFLGCIQCLNNSARSSGGALLARDSKINFRNSNDCHIFQANAAVERGGAFYAIDSTISLSGLLRFLLNSAQQGGALAVDSSSKLVLNQPLQVSFVQNNASFGGVIFYEDVFSASQCAKSNTNDTGNVVGSCFIELDSTSNIHLSFVNNTAGSAGTMFYGGNLDRCTLYVGGGVSDSCGNRISGNYSDAPITMIEEISDRSSADDITSNISSDPLRICFCEDDTLHCSDRVKKIVRGKEFTLMALIVGQNSGIVPSSIRTSLDNDIKISATQRIQNTEKKCTPITYRLSSNKSTISLILFPDGPCRDTGISRREITVNFLPCPDGFTLDGSECVCDERLQRYTNSCNVDDNSIERNSNTFWMGAVYDNATFGGLILHSGCPFDYCIETPIFLKLDNLDIQCNHNHSGILCGSCVDGYSLTFGTLHCLPCSNAYLPLIFPFALAGIALVAVLLLLQVSVASGTLNGLIFYANVVQVNRSIFFPPGDTNILTVFIAWLNLDLGIETCFFDGMNTYIFTWLQFMFPIYVWFLIGLIIVVSRFSSKIAHALGKNPVTALATLVLLSYSKILRTVIVALSSTSLEYPGNTTKVVWLYDGNIPYFQSASHIVLGTFAIAVLLFLFLPYTLLLLFGHWLLAYSDRWIFSWLNKIKPFLDAYHAPYKEDSRYWTGFILLVRCALFLTFAFNVLGNRSINLLAVTSVTVGLVALAWVRNRIYEDIFNDFLEAAFLLNLCILAVGTYHVKESGGSQAGLAYTSVGIALVLFICIVVYHVYLRLRTLGVWKKILKPDSKMFGKLILGHDKENEDDKKEAEKQDDEIVQIRIPTITTVELREPLLEK